VVLTVAEEVVRRVVRSEEPLINTPSPLG